MVTRDPHHVLGRLLFNPLCELAADPVKLRSLVVLPEETVGTVYGADIACDDEEITRVDLGEVTVEVTSGNYLDSAWLLGH